MDEMYCIYELPQIEAPAKEWHHSDGRIGWIEETGGIPNGFHSDKN